MKRFGGSLLRGGALFLAIAAATSFPILFGRILWPGGLGAGAELLFWPETGVAVAGLLLLGPRYWPAVLLGVFTPCLLLDLPTPRSLVNACANTAEALAAWWMIMRAGGFSGSFASLRTAGALFVAAVVCTSLSAIPGTFSMVAYGTISHADIPSALAIWWLANGSAMLLLTPFLVALGNGGGWTFPSRRREAALWLGTGLVIGTFAFDAIFRSQGVNLAFLTFPFVIYAAIRFGPAETAAALAFVMVSLYATMARLAGTIAHAEVAGVLTFLQAFSFVLAATGLAVAALVHERREADARAFGESKRALKISLLAERARLETLRYQINPHFLFNTLNSLRATLPHTAGTSREMLDGIADYFRSILDQPGGDTSLLRDEIESLRRYLAIEKTRFEDSLRISFRVDTDAESQPVPVFLLQPLVENAIRHGFTASPPPYHLEIRALRIAGRLAIEVANSGSWPALDTDASHEGIGIANIRERLRLLHGHDAALIVTADDGWVRAKIDLPCAA